jgi:hypothetical protein
MVGRAPTTTARATNHAVPRGLVALSLAAMLFCSLSARRKGQSCKVCAYNFVTQHDIQGYIHNQLQVIQYVKNHDLFTEFQCVVFDIVASRHLDIYPTEPNQHAVPKLTSSTGTTLLLQPNDGPQTSSPALYIEGTTAYANSVTVRTYFCRACSSTR